MYDVVIVGAGPAGCAAAHDLATGGRNVLLLDRCGFPRKKACAAGLTVKTLKALRYSVQPVIKRVCNHLAVGRRLEAHRLLRSDKPVCAMAVRSQFDAYCLEQTRAAGAAFVVSEKILGIKNTGSHVELETGEGVIKSRFLIGADGTHSRVRKLSGEFQGIRKGFAVEGLVPLEKKELDRTEMGFDFGVTQGGYGWVFPKGDHVNIGLYTFLEGEKLSREMLGAYAQKKYGDCRVEEIIGDPMGMGGWNYTPGDDRILLAGDAAGLVDPLTGEGLYNAVRSGQMAALSVERAIEAGTGAAALYAENLREIKSDLETCFRSAETFYRHLNLGYHVLTSRPVGYLLMKGFSRGMTLSRIKNRFYTLPFLP